MRERFDNLVDAFLKEIEKQSVPKQFSEKELLKERAKVSDFIDNVRKMSFEYDYACKELGIPKCPRCYYHRGMPDNYLGICDACNLLLIEALPRGDFGNPDSPEIKLLITCIKEANEKQLEKYKKK